MKALGNAKGGKKANRAVQLKAEINKRRAVVAALSEENLQRKKVLW